jgi:hypothetical protein
MGSNPDENNEPAKVEEEKPARPRKPGYLLQPNRRVTRAPNTERPEYWTLIDRSDPKA